jgi:hypothetical protein
MGGRVGTWYTGRGAISGTIGRVISTIAITSSLALVALLGAQCFESLGGLGSFP